MKKVTCPKCGKESLITHIKCDYCGTQLKTADELKNVVSVMTENNVEIKESDFEESFLPIQHIISKVLIIIGIVGMIVGLYYFVLLYKESIGMAIIIFSIFQLFIGAFLKEDYKRTQSKYALLVKEKIITKKNEPKKIEKIYTTSALQILILTMSIVTIILFIVIYCILNDIKLY